MSYQTADLSDANEGLVSICAPMFRSYGRRSSFHGPIKTLKVFEDNSLVRSTLETPGNGRVLVVDGGGSLRCALLGDNLAVLGVNNGWAGIVIYGCIRDSRTISTLDIGVFALATHPLRSVKRGMGEEDLTVTFGGVNFVSGHMLYADEDGLIVSGTQLAAG